MKRTKFSISVLISVIVVAALAIGAVAAEKPAKDKPAEPSAELKLLYKFVGNWQGTTIVHKTKQNPNETRDIHTLSCVRVLGGRFTLNKTVEPAGATSFHLTTYDIQQKCYRMWWFTSQGFAGELQGKWDNKTKIFTWRSTDKEETAVTRSWYADDNTAKWSTETKDTDGEVIFRMEGTYKRVKQLPKRKDAPAGKPVERSAEQKVLDRFIGTWRSEQKVVQAARMPEKKTSASDLTYNRVLGGKFVQERGKGRDADKTEALAMYAYDTQRKSYRLWWFSSTGQTTEATGRWEAETKTLRWTRVDNVGRESTMTARHRFANDNAIDWNVISKDGKGKVVFRMEGKATRLKKPAKKKGL